LEQGAQGDEPIPRRGIVRQQVLDGAPFLGVETIQQIAKK
jgi:hypothetical protein